MRFLELTALIVGCGIISTNQKDVNNNGEEVTSAGSEGAVVSVETNKSQIADAASIARRQREARGKIIIVPKGEGHGGSGKMHLSLPKIFLTAGVATSSRIKGGSGNGGGGWDQGGGGGGWGGQGGGGSGGGSGGGWGGQGGGGSGGGWGGQGGGGGWGGQGGGGSGSGWGGQGGGGWGGQGGFGASGMGNSGWGGVGGSGGSSGWGSGGGGSGGGGWGGGSMGGGGWGGGGSGPTFGGSGGWGGENFGEFGGGNSGWSEMQGCADKKAQKAKKKAQKKYAKAQKKYAKAQKKGGGGGSGGFGWGDGDGEDGGGEWRSSFPKENSAKASQKRWNSKMTQNSIEDVVEEGGGRQIQLPMTFPHRYATSDDNVASEPVQVEYVDSPQQHFLLGQASSGFPEKIELKLICPQNEADKCYYMQV